MSAKTSIEWTDRTWNPVRGCSKVSEGCRNCYAMKVATRFSGPGQSYEGLAKGGQWTGAVRMAYATLAEPLSWRKPQRVFVNSMSDLFHENLTFDQIAAVFAVMHAAPLHTFQVLTKRPQRMEQFLLWLESQGGIGSFVRQKPYKLRIYFDGVRRSEVVRGRRYRSQSDPWISIFNAAAVTSRGPEHNVWLGVSVEDQKTADERIPLLMRTPAAVRFLSCEPLLGKIDLGPFLKLSAETARHNSLHWVIVGGESGSGARAMNPNWVKYLRDQCVNRAIPFFFKQWGEWAPTGVTTTGGEISPGHFLKKIGKKKAGATLDGQDWREFPA